MAKQLECRVVITHGSPRLLHAINTFELGMYDPLNHRYEKLGVHPIRDIDRIVRDLKVRIEREGHLVSFSERVGPR